MQNQDTSPDFDDNEDNGQNPEDQVQAEEVSETSDPVEQDETSEAVDPVARIQELEAELADCNDKLMRALAETENVRRRAQRDREDAKKFAVSAFSREILSVADNMSRAMAAIDEKFRENNSEVEPLLVGLEMAEREMMATLEKFGIKRIDAEGSKFDHNLHEAMFEYEDKEKPAGTVTQVLETGYTIHDRLLRPAKVGVTKGGPKQAPAGNDKKTDGENKVEGATPYESQGAGPGGKIDEEL